jgi:hypothetical protein
MPDFGAARTRPGYEDCTSGAFRATVECADALRRRRLPALGRLGLPAANLAQAQARPRQHPRSSHGREPAALLPGLCSPV